MDFLILYLILSTLQSVKADCSLSDSQCSYTLTCVDYVDMNYEFARTEYRYQALGLQQGVNCEAALTYKGNEYYAVELVFEQNYVSDTLTPIPALNYYGYEDLELMDIILSLDLSHNRYYTTPTIIRMRSLVKLNLSMNRLTTAVLSNTYKLNVLSEIDLSHNMINNIQVKNSEHAYINLTKIDLSHNLLVKIDETTFSKFYYLQKVNLSYNNIDTLNQLSFEYNEDLTVLDIAYNRLLSINSCLMKLRQLKNLNVSKNQIENIQPNEFERLVKLETLNLSSNIIRKINISVFQNTIGLKDIDLSNNLLESVDNKTFSNLRLLSSVNISKNKLKSLPLGLFKHNILNFSIGENRLQGSLVKGMLEHINTSKLDFSYQSLTEIKNYAFYNLTMLKVLLLNSNKIVTLSNNSFGTLTNLEFLNLSNNQISSLNFDKKDLGNLKILFLQYNRLTEISHTQFEQFVHLEHLNLTGNQISHIGLNIFHSLQYLVNFDISNNSLVGTLKSGTFDGLHSIPILDISRCMLTSLQNASFNNMANLKELNTSRCKISELQFNVFINTGSMEVIDLSHNKLHDFTINTTDLFKLSKLLLNYNLIKTVLPKTLNNLYRLKIFDLSHNEIQHISDYTKDNLSAVKNMLKATLYLESLNYLYLSYNNISILQIEDFVGLRAINVLDLSFNKICLIQPGVFRSNTDLNSLNISHNLLNSVNYGVFRGLSNLNILNMSYNNLRELQSETFFDTKKLTRLIADFNEIESINTLETFSTHLEELSIGDNPLSCETLVKHERARLGLKITAIRISEHSQENVNGVVCNKNLLTKTASVTENINKNDLFEKWERELFKVSNVINQSTEMLSNIENFNNNTNILLENIIQMFTKYFDSTNNSKSQSHYTGLDHNTTTKSVVTEVCVALILLTLVAIILYHLCKYRLCKNKFAYKISNLSENEENSTL